MVVVMTTSARCGFPHGMAGTQRDVGREQLHRLGVTDKVIQAIPRHANVSTTASYYIKTNDEDVLAAMTRLENTIDEERPTLSSASTSAFVQ